LKNATGGKVAMYFVLRPGEVVGSKEKGAEKVHYQLLYSHTNFLLQLALTSNPEINSCYLLSTSLISYFEVYVLRPMKVRPGSS
jgi:hypothetical protein